VQTLWAAGKLELLRSEMKRFIYDIIGISEVRWTGKGKTPNGDFIYSGEETSHMRGVDLLLTMELFVMSVDLINYIRVKLSPSTRNYQIKNMSC
jgi:hypothetical protein